FANARDWRYPQLNNAVERSRFLPGASTRRGNLGRSPRDKEATAMSEGLVTEVVAFGECMVEVGLTGPSQAALGYAGDTFNTAVYLRRLGLSVAYGTAIGEGDPFSAGILR